MMGGTSRRGGATTAVADGRERHKKQKQLKKLNDDVAYRTCTLTWREDRNANTNISCIDYSQSSITCVAVSLPMFILRVPGTVLRAIFCFRLISEKGRKAAKIIIPGRALRSRCMSSQLFCVIKGKGWHAAAGRREGGRGQSSRQPTFFHIFRSFKTFFAKVRERKWKRNRKTARGEMR